MVSHEKAALVDIGKVGTQRESVLKCFFWVFRRGKKGEFFEASTPAGLVSLHHRRQEDGTEDKCAYFSCYFKCGHFLHFLDQQIRRCYQKCAFRW